MHTQTIEMNKKLVPMLYKLMHATSHYAVDGYPYPLDDFYNQFNCEYSMEEMVLLIVDGLHVRDEFSEYVSKMNEGK